MTRGMITKETLRKFMEAVGRVLKKEATLYLTGGATAILYGFRHGTIDVDIAGDMDELFSLIPSLKERLHINIELAKPSDFVPRLHGESKRHILIGYFGKVRFMHFDPYSQAFSKIVRGHVTDMADVKSLMKQGLVDADKLNKLVKEISATEFARYPQLNREAVEFAVDEYVSSVSSSIRSPSS